MPDIELFEIWNSCQLIDPCVAYFGSINIQPFQVRKVLEMRQAGVRNFGFFEVELLQGIHVFQTSQALVSNLGILQVQMDHATKLCHMGQPLVVQCFTTQMKVNFPPIIVHGDFSNRSSKILNLSDSLLIQRGLSDLLLGLPFSLKEGFNLCR